MSTGSSMASRLSAPPGLSVIIALAVLTLVEYIVSVADTPGVFVWLTVIAVAKAAFIVVAFMHVMNIFREEHP